MPFAYPIPTCRLNFSDQAGPSSNSERKPTESSSRSQTMNEWGWIIAGGRSRHGCYYNVLGLHPQLLVASFQLRNRFVQNTRCARRSRQYVLLATLSNLALWAAKLSWLDYVRATHQTNSIDRYGNHRHIRKTFLASPPIASIIWTQPSGRRLRITFRVGRGDSTEC